MIAIKTIRKFIESNPSDPDAKALGSLVLALETDGDIAVPKLYGLKFKHFELAIEMLKEWRLDRYYSSKIRLLDIAAQLANLPEEPVAKAEPKKAQPKVEPKAEVKAEAKPEPKKADAKKADDKKADDKKPEVKAPEAAKPVAAVPAPAPVEAAKPEAAKG